MVRNYVRKSTIGSGYSQETLTIAVDLIKSGSLSTYRASKIYKIPKNTLADHVKGRRVTSLADCICCLEKWGFGLTRKEIIKIVADYVRVNNIKTQFKNGIPGEDWFLNFKRRHNLSLTTPQSVEFARKKNVDPFLIYDYFDLLEKTVKELGLDDKPSQIWNLKESSFCCDPSKTKIVGQKGYPSTRTTSGPGKQNTTVLMCCSAIGDKAPPLIIFKGKNVWDQWVAPPDTEFPNTTYAATSNGWMESAVFKNYFQKSFIKHLSDDRPVLVIYNGHATHLSVDVFKTAIENQITILKLPPHTSHLLQPLDLSVFKSLKTRWDAKLVEWQRKNVGVKIPKCIFSKLIGEIWTDTKPEIIINGFVKAGISPINRNVVPVELFDPTAIQRWKSRQAQKIADVSLPSTSSVSDIDH
ncbi:jerky protein homolog-like [Onthophagus taurus]|uniref:jerky protein homolog-like n=1 Tax=Onthophagus taurus TaxID=166361 RepID=UPI0039BE2346